MKQSEAIPDAVAAVLAGDAARFGDIVRAFDGPVRRAVARRLRDADALEDVVQEVWIRVYRQVRSLLDLRSAEAWIRRVAENCVFDHQRAHARKRHMSLPADGAEAGGGDGDRWVWEIVASMPAAQQDLLGWCYRDGHSHAEIGRRLGVPASTVRGRLFDARQALRVRLQQRRMP